jgi:hypothetical protein
MDHYPGRRENSALAPAEKTHMRSRQALSDRRRRKKQREELQLDYQDHRVDLEAHQDPSLCDWTATAYIEFTESHVVHTIVLKPQGVFGSEQEARKFISAQVRAWIDHRLCSKSSLRRPIAAELCDTIST